MRRFALALLVVAGCGGGTDPTNNAADNAVEDAVQTASLTGLYEGGGSPRPSQLCVIDQGTGSATFGLVVWGANMHSCSGAGQAVQEGDRLRLTMAGDESCAIEARIDNGKVALPQELPAGCSYYCGAQAKLGGASFEKVGGTAEDAMKATDLVGEPLCGEAAAPG